MIMDPTIRTHHQLEEEFDELFSKIFKYLRIRISSDQDAEDITADVFAKAWKRAHAYDAEQGTLTMWLFGIARHEAATYWKSRSVKQVDYDAVESILHDDGRGVARRNDEIDLARIMHGLSEEQRVLTVRHYLDGISHAEIARSVGRSESAVRKIVSRAIRAVKDTGASL